MGSKAIVFLALLVAMLVLISSEVAARDLVEETAQTTDAEPAQYGGGRGRRCRYGCCRQGYYGCIRCCRYAGQAVEAGTHN